VTDETQSRPRIHTISFNFDVTAPADDEVTKTNFFPVNASDPEVDEATKATSRPRSRLTLRL
jgi:hypothetical protein